MFDPRNYEADRIRKSATSAGLDVRYVELTEGVHHYSIANLRRDRHDEHLLAQRLAADEALAFLEGYRLGRESRGGLP